MTTGAVAQLLASLLAVIAMIFVFAWISRRMPGRLTARTGVLRLHSSVAVGTRERVVLMQAGKDWLVLGVSPGQVRTLHVLDAAPEDFAGVLAEQTAK
jgi:flagellar protein FliO/FliZ